MNKKNIALIAIAACIGLYAEEESSFNEAENQAREIQVVANEEETDQDLLSRDDSCRRERCKPRLRACEREQSCKKERTKSQSCNKARKGAAKRVVEGD